MCNVPTQRYIATEFILTPEQTEDIRTALQLRANLIETGNPVLSAQDYRDRGKLCRDLDDAQYCTVLRLRDLARKLVDKEVP